MYIEALKKELLEIIKVRPFFTFHEESILIETLISYEMSLILKNSPKSKYTMDFDNNLEMSQVSNVNKTSSVDLSDLISLVEKNNGYNSYQAIELREKVGNLQKSKDKKLKQLDDKIYTISNLVRINAPFAKTLKELKEFAKEKEYFYFNNRTSQIETEIVKPKIEVKFITYDNEDNIIDLSFELDAFGQKWSMSDLIFYKNKKCFKDLFTSYEELIDFKIKEAESNLNYFKSLKKSSDSNDYRINNAVRY